MYTLIYHNTSYKALVIKEPDRVRVYKYTTSPADILAYNIPDAVKEIVRAFYP